MCGRYIFFDGKNQKTGELVNLAEKKLNRKVFDQIAINEVFPSSKALIGVAVGNDVHTVIMQWGFASNHGLVINARSETAFSSPFFKNTIPCCAIASAYYEWSKDKSKYTFIIPDETMYLAGLARQEKDGLHYVILTEEAEEPARKVHSRQPVVFSYENAKRWCLSHHPESLLSESLKKRIFYPA